MCAWAARGRVLRRSDSAQPNTIAGLLAPVFGDFESQLRFVLSREQCVPYALVDKPYNARKPLRVVYERFVGSTPQTTIMLDDSHSKGIEVRVR